jgi:flagellar biosynthesis protein FliP
MIKLSILRVVFAVLMLSGLLATGAARGQAMAGVSVGPDGGATSAASKFSLSSPPTSSSTSIVRPLTSDSAGSPGSSIRLPQLTGRENVSSAMEIIIVLTVLGLAPSILLMMTSFTRMIIVLSLLRQALGTQQLPPNQVLIGLALFMTLAVMGPTLKSVNDQAIQPYLAAGSQMTPEQAFERGTVPLRAFMAGQIQKWGNAQDVDLFQKFAHQPPVSDWRTVPMTSLVPGFILSELKTAFLIGFKIYLPFLIIDMVISSVLISMGMMMLPPALISLPFKLLLFVLVDGWTLIAGSLMGSFTL